MPKKKSQADPLQEIPPELLSQVMSALGKKGGKAGKGKAKARSSEQARAAVNVRWSKRKENQG
jgi:hypothetical protein